MLENNVFLAFVWQIHYKKEKSESKPTELRLKIYFETYPVIGGGTDYIYIYIVRHCLKVCGDKNNLDNDSSPTTSVNENSNAASKKFIEKSRLKYDFFFFLKETSSDF